MDTKWLETFAVAAREGSFAAAADELRYARSTVTHQIRCLERSLGAPLFDRDAPGQPLTRAGLSFIPYAEGVLQQMEDARDTVRESVDRGATVRMGATETTCAHRLPMFLRSVARLLPNIRIDVEVASAKDVRDRLKRGKLALTLTTAHAGEEHTRESKPLWEERPVLVRAAPGAGAPDRVLMTRRGCPYRELLDDEYLPRHPGTETMEIGTIEGVKAGVLNGLGVGLVPLVAVRSNFEAGTLRQLPWKSRKSVQTRLEWDPDSVGSALNTHFGRLHAAT